MKNSIKLTDVVKKYKDFTLGEINLEIPCGFSTALIGSNGAGKTTLIDVMCRISGKNSGDITYFEKYKEADDNYVRNNSWRMYYGKEKQKTVAQRSRYGSKYINLNSDHSICVSTVDRQMGRRDRRGRTASWR